MGNGKDRTKGEVGLSTYLETLRKFKKYLVVLGKSRDLLDQVDWQDPHFPGNVIFLTHV